MPAGRVNSRLDLLGTIEGHYASELVLGLLRCGILERLSVPCDARTLARPLGMDIRAVDQALDFLARTTEIISRDTAGRYQLEGTQPIEIAFQFEKFIGAYGGSIRGLPMVLFGLPNKTPVRDAALAAAFGAIANASSKVARRLQRSGCRSLLDLGCGPASLPIEMALADDKFRGVGIDSSHAMCRLAKSRIREAGLGSRVKVYRKDICKLRDVLDARHRRGIDAVHGRSVLNTLFGRDNQAARSFLLQLRRDFPGRTAFFVDYYGELGGAAGHRARFRLAQIQDLAQIASGQGVPPPDREAWDRLYRQAGCKLMKSSDFRSTDIRWFIHEVHLQP